MNDAGKTRAQLIEELEELRKQVPEHRVIENEPGESRHREILWGVQHQLRNAVAKMQSSDDIQHVLSVLREGFHELGIPFQDCGINLVDPHRDPAVRTLSSLGREEEWVSPEQAWGQDLVLRIWKDGVPVYRRDLQAEDVYGERHENSKYFGHPVRSVVDAPFSYGTLAVNSGEPDAFTKENIADLTRLTVVLEEGFRRVEDLRALEQRNRDLEQEVAERTKAEGQLEENERLLNAYHQIGKTILSTMDLDEILKTLAEQIVTAGIFKTLAISLVNEESQYVKQILSVHMGGNGFEWDIPDPLPRYPLNDRDILAETARTGEMQIAVGWDDRFTLRPGKKREDFKMDRAFFFIPVKQEDRAVAVLATGSSIEEKEEVLHRIEVMKPLLDQFAIALEHARLYENAREEITERKRMEQELIRLERLRAVGELSAGVSHNLNNILTSVLGPAQLLKRKMDDPDLLREADEIITSTRRARDLVHELHLSVRTAGEESLIPVSVDQVVQQAIQGSRPRWKDESEARGISIDIITHWGDVPSVRGTDVGLHAVFTNLIFNAVDAMPEGGTITIRTERAEGQVQIAFSDTGIGMDEEICRRVFEPFFTTKMDVGSGLGLSTAYNTITGWGGTIEVNSTSGEGTTFTLRFPVWTEREAEREEKTVDAPRVRSGKILIVDDDEAVLSLLARLLGGQHGVETATDGRKALERFAPGAYDVALIDLGMSGMSGDELMRQMRQIDPLVATVLITGWGLPDTDTRVMSFDFQMQKPFDDLDEVENVVARAIELHLRRVDGRP